MPPPRALPPAPPLPPGPPVGCAAVADRPTAPPAPAAPLAALFITATFDSATLPPSISRPPPSAALPPTMPPSSVARPPAMVRPCNTTERPELLPTISNTRLVDSALMTELDSPCPTMVSVLLFRLELLSMTQLAAGHRVGDAGDRERDDVAGVVIRVGRGDVGPQAVVQGQRIEVADSRLRGGHGDGVGGRRRQAGHRDLEHVAAALLAQRQVREDRQAVGDRDGHRREGGPASGRWPARGSRCRCSSGRWRRRNPWPRR